MAYADEHGIEPRAQVIGGSREEAELRALGWVDCYVPTEVLAVRLADFLAGPPPRAGVRVVEELEPSWWAAYQQSRPNSADPAILRMILDGHPPRAFASADDRTRAPSPLPAAISAGTGWAWPRSGPGMIIAGRAGPRR